MLVGCAVQVAAAIVVFTGAAKHGMLAQAVVTALWLAVSVCAVIAFFSNAALV